MLLKSIKLPGADNVRYLARRRSVYVGHAEKALSVIDAQTYEVKAEIKLPGRPEGFQLDAKRPRLYMNTVEPTRLVVVDTDKNEVLQSHPLTLADRAYPMAVDEANHRLFLGCRDKPSVVVLDSETGQEVASVAIPEDIDDLFYDAKNKRLYASCGAGTLAVIRQRDADHYGTLETIPTADPSVAQADAGNTPIRGRMPYFFGRKSLQSCIRLLESPVSIVTGNRQRGSYERSVPEKA